MNTAADGAFNFRRRLADALASEDWRALDRAVARWVLAHGGSPLLARVAAWASYAEGQGDSVLIVAGEGSGRYLPALGEDALQALAAEPLVAVADRAAGGSGSSDAGAEIDSDDCIALSPFVLDGEQFYLRRNFAHEQALAAAIRARRGPSLSSAHSAAEVDGALQTLTAQRVEDLFGGDNSTAVQAQREAVAEFGARRLFVLTGGPGTGKTTTVLRMLLLRVRQHTERYGEPPRLRLAAPTGKAAQRLAESLQAGGLALRSGSSALGAEWQPALDHVLQAEAGTLHRLLGSRGPSRGHAYHAGRPLPLDLLVVDEASMVDLALLRAVFEALPESASLLLVGDAEQLSSVGTGSVLRDLVDALQAAPRGDLVRLSHSFRAEQSLQAVNQAIQAGDVEAFDSACRSAESAVLRREVDSPRALAAALQAHARAIHAQLQAADAFAALPADPAAEQQAVQACLTELRQQQLLCALRETAFGARAADASLSGLLKARLDIAAGQAWFAGRAVMIQQNDYPSGLFNGDVGLCLRSADGQLRVWFETRSSGDASGAADPAQATRLRAFSPGSLPVHAGAFAITVHKSQGSEYARVALLLPPEATHPILARALVYTGATRARQALELWASTAALRAAIAQPSQRVSGLRQRLLDR
jgi:exodeoxyribonuclease V alpha subunit